MKFSFLTLSFPFVVSGLNQLDGLPLSYRGKKFSGAELCKLLRNLSFILAFIVLLDLQNCISNLEIRLYSSFIVRVSLILHHFACLSEQALDLLVSVSYMHYCTSTSDLSPCSLQGVLLLSDGISLLEGGFTLRCLQRLSFPDLATLPCTWYATDTPAVCPFRSSRTKNSSSQISYAHDG